MESNSSKRRDLSSFDIPGILQKGVISAAYYLRIPEKWNGPEPAGEEKFFSGNPQKKRPPRAALILDQDRNQPEFNGIIR
jgi:hypothetical protein